MKIWIALILFASGYALYPIMWHGFFYQAIATSFLFLFWHLKPLGLPAKIGFWFSVNALVDELFFDPTKINLNEYLFGILIILILWQEHRLKKAAK